MSVDFPSNTDIFTLEVDDFLAEVHRDNDGAIVVTVSTGVVKDAIALWQQAKELSEQIPEENRLKIDDIDKAVDASLTWLMLHELHHEQIGHLELVGSAGISEVKRLPELGLTRRAKSKPSLLDKMTKDEVLAIQRCLELQADHDAQEILLGHYSKQNWESIRFHASCVMAMMVLIDQQDRKRPVGEALVFSSKQ